MILGIEKTTCFPCEYKSGVVWQGFIRDNATCNFSRTLEEARNKVFELADSLRKRGVDVIIRGGVSNE